jgi:hypothetical protein
MSCLTCGFDILSMHILHFGFNGPFKVNLDQQMLVLAKTYLCKPHFVNKMTNWCISGWWFILADGEREDNCLHNIC